MKPVKTKNANLVYRGPTSDIGDLWVERDAVNGAEGTYRVIRSVWEPSDDERAVLTAGGRIELEMFTEPIPPISISVIAKEYSEPVGEHGWKGQEL